MLCSNLSNLAQSIKIVESPHLQKVFLLLREELHEADIPGRAALRNCIMNRFSENIEMLPEDMKVS